MADRSLIFSGPMIRALLDGRKTQTRRIVRPQPEQNVAGMWVWPPNWRTGIPRYGVGVQTDEDGLVQTLTYDSARRLRYAPGDRLWVREAWAAGACAGDMPPNHLAPRFWRVENGGLWYRAGGEPAHPITPRGKWRSPIHMPRWASRLTLTVTEVRVTRLQEISEEDARAEGVRGNAGGPWGCEGLIEDFADLWESIHGPGAWEANPWVAAISFTVMRGNIDA